MTATPSSDSLAAAPISSSRRIHLPALDGMRGIGILAVMVTHFANHDPSLKGFSDSAAILDVSAWAMTMFFLLSGFLITGILLEAREKPHYFRNFFARRVLRIFPLYYGVLAILFVLHPGWGHAIGGSLSRRWLWLYGSNIEMARHETRTYGFLSHFWSLAVEEQYYLVWPFIVAAFRPRKLFFVCCALGLLSVVFRIVFVEWGNHVVSAYILTPCQLDPLCTGGALAILVRRGGLPRLRAPARVAVAGSLGVFFLLGWYKLGILSRTLVIGRPLLSCFLFGGVLLLAAGDSGICRRVLGARAFTFLGKYSYGLYVFHFPLLPVFKVCFPREAIGRSVGSPLAGLLFAVLFSITSTLLLSIASYELYEKRFLRLKGRFGSA